MSMFLHDCIFFHNRLPACSLILHHTSESGTVLNTQIYILHVQEQLKLFVFVESGLQYMALVIWEIETI